MADFPLEIYVTIEDEGDNMEWLNANKSKLDAVENTSNDGKDDGVRVATYQLVNIKKLKLTTTVLEE